MRRQITTMEQLMPFPTAQELIDKKKEIITSVNPSKSVFDAMQLMAEKNVRFMPVIENGSLAGILSERDCARKIILGRLDAEKTQVSEIMTKDVSTVSPDTKIPECISIMYQKDVGYLPVEKGKEIIGVLSIRELMGALIERHERLLRKLSDERLTLLYQTSGVY